MHRANIVSVASSMAINVRTLQREFKAEGTSFHDLISDVRLDLCLGYLGSSDLTVAQISNMLGYSSPSAFIRWFRPRFDMPPQAWRDTQAMGASIGKSASN